MKSFLFKLIALLMHPRMLLSEKTIAVASRFTAQQGNKIQTNQSHIKKSRVFISGKGNVITMDNTDIFHSSIRIEGNGNRITIKGHTRLYNLNIILKGENGLISIDEYTSFGGGTIVCGGKSNYIRIGKRCMIAEGVEIWNSDTHTITINGRELENNKPIVIHDHVWLGKDVSVLKGVTIGENAIVGMKSIVTHSINAGTVNAGIPAKEIQKDANWIR